ncbi:MAG: 50S ribosome-binding GTPase [Abditibacteriales bacterium]|nr:50S ribosome-binding GTPase [Abditibacteriales bacterium]
MSCGTKQGLIRLGIDLSHFDYVVAIAGNPNTGKSTVFNALTGLKQHTGNWPGKTVARMEGMFAHHGKRFKLVDLPGTYSLLSMTVDEEVARDFLLFGQPDTTVIVVDATNLERNLNLVLQVLEITDRAVVCLNLMDEAQRRGITIDDRELARELGVPVVPTVARRREGLDRLVEAIAGVATGAIRTNPRRLPCDPQTQAALDELVPLLENAVPGLPNARWVAMRLLDGDERVIEALENGELAQLVRPRNSATTRIEGVVSA